MRHRWLRVVAVSATVAGLQVRQIRMALQHHPQQAEPRCNMRQRRSGKRDDGKRKRRSASERRRRSGGRRSGRGKRPP
jgi:hypothetical protein